METANAIEQIRKGNVPERSQPDDFYQVVYLDDDRYSGSLEATLNVMHDSGWLLVQAVHCGVITSGGQTGDDSFTLIFSRLPEQPYVRSMK